MQTKRGKVQKVVHTEEVDREDGVDTVTYRVSFRIDGQKIRFESSEKPKIHEDDNVCVAGTLDAGLFVAYGYKNLTNGASGEEFKGIGTRLFFSQRW